MLTAILTLPRAKRMELITVLAQHVVGTAAGLRADLTAPAVPTGQLGI